MKRGIFLLETEAVVDIFKSLGIFAILKLFHSSTEGPDCVAANPVNACLHFIERMVKANKFESMMEPHSPS